jgi:valyl-tRNA synthetase
MLHPFMPFITEELWQKHMTVTGAMLTMQRWPKHAEWPDNPTAQAQVGNVVAAVAAVRQVRSQLRISPKVALTLGYRGTDVAVANLLAQAALLQTLGNVTALVPHPAPAGRGEALLLAGEVELILPLEGLVDVAQERARLEKEQAKVAQDLQKLQGLLANAGFVAKAPAEVLAENRARVAELSEQAEKLAGLLEGAYAL